MSHALHGIGIRAITPRQWGSALPRRLSLGTGSGGPQVLTYVHPCVIDGRRHLVYERGLAQREPGVFATLARFARATGQALREDRRHQARPPQHERRTRWAPVLLLAFGVAAEGAVAGHPTAEAAGAPEAAASAAVTPGRNRPASGVARSRTLHLVALHGSDGDGGPDDELMLESGTEPVASAATGNRPPGPSPAARELRRILRGHYPSGDGGPAHVPADLDEMADYYARFPEVVSLLRELDAHPWRLRYEKDTWAAKARGNPVAVHSVEIAFDPRAAARLRRGPRCEANPACILSPADALLHELLHARSMLLDTRSFLAQGGMSTLLYPYAHESTVMAEEGRLYQGMSRLDGTPRPQRSQHTGQIVQASCALCTR
jgi:hypothetical protein